MQSHRRARRNAEEKRLSGQKNFETEKWDKKTTVLFLCVAPRSSRLCGYFPARFFLSSALPLSFLPVLFFCLKFFCPPVRCFLFCNCIAGEAEVSNLTTWDKLWA